MAPQTAKHRRRDKSRRDGLEKACRRWELYENRKARAILARQVFKDQLADPVEIHHPKPAPAEPPEWRAFVWERDFIW